MSQALLDLWDFVDTIDPFADEALWRFRQALVAEAELTEADVVARCSFLVTAYVAFDGAGRFDLEIEGIEAEPAVIIGALDEFERLLDVVAWPLGRRSVLATLLGAVAMLGEEQALRHPETVFSPPLRVHRTAEAWVRSGFVGIVPIDRLRSADILLDVAGPVLAEDDLHATELDDARRELVERGARILVAA